MAKNVLGRADLWQGGTDWKGPKGGLIEEGLPVFLLPTRRSNHGSCAQRRLLRGRAASGMDRYTPGL